MKRNEEKYHNTKIDILCQMLLYVILPVIVIGIIFLITFTSHASGNESTAYFPMQQNDNNKFPDYLKDYLDTQFDNENNFIFASYSTEEWSYSTKHSYYYVCYFSKQYNDGIPFIYGEIHSNGYEFGLYKSPSYTVSCCRVRMSEVYSNGNLSSYTFRVNNNYGDNLANFQNFTSSLYSTNSSFVSNFKMYVNNQQNANLVLKYGSDSVPILTGHATPPEEYETPIYPQGHSKPQTVPPTYTVNNYSWTTYTPPVVDNSTLEKLLESLTDIVKYNATYLKDNLHNEFTNLIDNIKGLIEYIGETIQYYGDLIISNIQNLITTFYNNMVSIGEDITEKLTYIVSPLDTSALQTAIENTGIYTDYDRIFDMVGDAFGFYNDITEPTTFKIPIDLRNVTILHQTQILYIDLGWLNSCKIIIRAFMWCVLTFGLLYTIIDSIPDYLNGNDE